MNTQRCKRLYEDIIGQQKIGVELDLPIPSTYMRWQDIPIKTSNWLVVGRRLRERWRSEANTPEQREKADRMVTFRQEQFESNCGIEEGHN